MTEALRTSTATPAAAMNGNQVYGARALYVDMKTGSLLLRHARQGAVTRVFGVPPEEQSFLVTVILIGAAGTAVGGLMPRPWHRPSRMDAAMGGSLVDATFRGIAGTPSREIPLAGALIAAALLAHALRPAVAGTASGVRAMTRHVRHGFHARYWH